LSEGAERAISPVTICTSSSTSTTGSAMAAAAASP
jgi:hypothetical protein